MAELKYQRAFNAMHDTFEAMYVALEAYDKAEADILENANWYTETGVPRITQEQFDRLIECQTLKAKALHKARGEE